jgi:hypothetical protein
VRAAVLEADGALSFVKDESEPEPKPGGSQTGPDRDA